MNNCTTLHEFVNLVSRIYGLTLLNPCDMMFMKRGESGVFAMALSEANCAAVTRFMCGTT